MGSEMCIRDRSSACQTPSRSSSASQAERDRSNASAEEILKWDQIDRRLDGVSFSGRELLSRTGPLKAEGATEDRAEHQHGPVHVAYGRRRRGGEEEDQRDQGHRHAAEWARAELKALGSPLTTHLFLAGLFSSLARAQAGPVRSPLDPP